jgi:predicted nucleic-acid-binding protein
MRAVDTNVLVRLVARDDARQFTAAESFVRPGAWASHVVLAEVAWVLDSVYALKPAKIADGIEMLLEHESLAIQDAEVVRAAVARFRGRPTVGFSDCLILEAARKAGHLPLGTFDRSLAKLDGVEAL